MDEDPDLYPDLYEDGNALAGPLDEVFAVEASAAVTRCGSCGRTGRVAELRVYGRGAGLVARCPGCQEVVLRLVRTPREVWLDLRGTVSLRLPVGGPG